tara:strand:- start:204 stop:422 length:219 start_codon:yes stop_codon:yes gene_type:complete
MFEGTVIGKQVVLYSMLMVFNFETEADCEAAAKIVHKDAYIEGGCWKSFKYVHAPIPGRPDELWRSVSGGRE